MDFDSPLQMKESFLSLSMQKLHSETVIPYMSIFRLRQTQQQSRHSSANDAANAPLKAPKALLTCMHPLTAILLLLRAACLQSEAVCGVGNKLEQLGDVLHLEQCRTLVTLDLSSNRISSEDAVQLVMKLPLSLLKLNGNPVVTVMRYVHFARKQRTQKKSMLLGVNTEASVLRSCRVFP